MKFSIRNGERQVSKREGHDLSHPANALARHSEPVAAAVTRRERARNLLLIFGNSLLGGAALQRCDQAVLSIGGFSR